MHTYALPWCITTAPDPCVAQTPICWVGFLKGFGCASNIVHKAKAKVMGHGAKYIRQHRPLASQNAKFVSRLTLISCYVATKAVTSRYMRLRRCASGDNTSCALKIINQIFAAHPIEHASLTYLLGSKITNFAVLTVKPCFASFHVMHYVKEQPYINSIATAMGIACRIAFILS